MKNFISRLAWVSLLALLLGAVALALVVQGTHLDAANTIALLAIAGAVLSLKETR